MTGANDDEGSGGAVYVASGTAEFDRCLFSSNEARWVPKNISVASELQSYTVRTALPTGLLVTYDSTAHTTFSHGTHLGYWPQMMETPELVWTVRWK